MSKLEKIRQACIVANSEIVELKFGCILERNALFVFPKYAFFLKKEAGFNKFRYISMDKDLDTKHGIYAESDLDKWEITGRPITLADVFMAINEKVSITKAGGELQDERNVLINWYLHPDGGVDEPLWNLSLPLSGQSEETLDFLHKVLSNE